MAHGWHRGGVALQLLQRGYVEEELGHWDGASCTATQTGDWFFWLLAFSLFHPWRGLRQLCFGFLAQRTSFAELAQTREDDWFPGVRVHRILVPAARTLATHWAGSVGKEVKFLLILLFSRSDDFLTSTYFGDHFGAVAASSPCGQMVSIAVDLHQKLVLFPTTKVNF